MITKYVLPEAGINTINDYESIEVGNKKVVAPYYMNKRKLKGGLRVMIGKGSPDEIEREVMVLAQVKGFDIDKAEPSEVRKFMQDRDIGIDCSGFVVHVLNAILKDKKMGSIDAYLQYNQNGIVSRLRRLLRPVENTGANVLTGINNCNEIKDINQVRPGNLIRSKGKVKNSHHVILIDSVTLRNNEVSEITYAQSNENYGENNGVRRGIIKITDPAKPIWEQDWHDQDQNGGNPTLEGVLIEKEDNGIRALKRVSIPFVQSN